MTTMELRQSLFNEVNALLDNEELTRAAIRALQKLRKKATTEEKTEYISKQEILDGIREGLTDMYRAQRTGEKQKTLQEAINEL